MEARIRISKEVKKNIRTLDSPNDGDKQTYKKTDIILHWGLLYKRRNRESFKKCMEIKCPFIRTLADSDKIFFNYN